MARVVLCSQNLPVPHDPRVWREATALADDGHDVTVICPRRRALAFRETLERVRIVRYPAPPDLPGTVGLVVETANALVWTALVTLALRTRGRIDVLHAANPPDTFFVVALLLRTFGTRFVYDQHDLCPELLDARTGRTNWAQDRVLRWLEWRSYRAADLVIAPNGSYRAIATGRGDVPAERVIVVRSGADHAVEEPPRSDHPPAGPAIVTFAGVMGVHDGVELLLDAAAQVLRRQPGSLVLDLIGSGTAVPALEARARELGIESAVRWAGWLTGGELRERLGQATIAVSPDPDDAFSRRSTMTKVTDYLALGLPSVVADLPETRVTAGDAALYFAPGDADQLAAQLARLLDDVELREELGRRAIDRAPHLLWSSSAARLRASYRWLLDDEAPVVGEQLPAAGIIA